MTSHRHVLEAPEGWAHLQQWFARTNDPLRPWNVSAISRHAQLPQAVVRSLLTGPKGADGMSRTAFTLVRLRYFQRVFRRYGYRVAVPEAVAAHGPCRPIPQLADLQPAPYTFTG